MSNVSRPPNLVKLWQLLLLLVAFSFSILSETKAQMTRDLLQRLESVAGEERLALINEIGSRMIDRNPIYVLSLLLNHYPKEFSTQTSPHFPEALLLMSRAYMIRGQLDSCQLRAKQAFDLFALRDDSAGKAKAMLLSAQALAEQLDIEEAKQQAFAALDIFRTLGIPTLEGRAFHTIGYIYYWADQADSSLANYRNAIKIHRELEDSLELSNGLLLLGQALYHFDFEIEALEALVACKHMKEHLDDPYGLARVHNSIGILHEEKNNWETALSYYQQSIPAYRKAGALKNLSNVLNNIGIVYLDQQLFDSAFYYLNASLSLRKNIAHHDGVAQSYMNIGELYQTQEKYTYALNYLDSARQYATQHATYRPLAPTLSRMGSIYTTTGRLDSAEKYLLEAIAITDLQSDYFSSRGTYRRLADLYEEQGRFEKALRAFREYNEIKDSFQQVSAAKELAEVQERYDAEKRELEITRLEGISAKRTRSRNLLAGALILSLFGATAIFLFTRYRNKKNFELLEAKEIQRRELLKLNELKSRFFSNISHEFRTPLTLILGPIQQLIDRTDNAKDLNQLQIVKNNGERLLRLINQLLELSRIESGKVPLKARYLDVIPLLKGWVMSFQSVAEMKGIKLSLLAEEDRYMLYLDREKIENVVVNLVANAIKFTEEGGEITVEVSSQDSESDGWLSIQVKDSGSGIPEEELEHVFDRFYQASNADVSQNIGTGIGLSLIKEMVDLHHGKIEVESEVGKGSIFTLWLPLGKDHLIDDEIAVIAPAFTPDATSFDVTPQEQTGQDIQMDALAPIALVIEDNEDLQVYIQGILAEQYQVKIASNGMEGIEMAFEMMPDLIVSDVMMPKKDGIEVCRTLKNDHRTSHIPIILLTAQSTVQDRLRGLQNLADDFISKPFNVEELKQRCANLVEIRRSMHQKFSGPAILTPKKIQLRSMDEKFTEMLIEVIEDHIDSEFFGVQELAEALSLSRSQLYRKVKFITDMTPVEFLRSYRLQRAKDLLEQKSGNVNEIAYQVGFQNASYFAKTFAEKFGKSPSDVLKG